MYKMATAERVNVEEGKDLLALKQLERREVPYRVSRGIVAKGDTTNTFDDLAEYTGCHLFLWIVVMK